MTCCLISSVFGSFCLDSFDLAAASTMTKSLALQLGGVGHSSSWVPIDWLQLTMINEGQPWAVDR